MSKREAALFWATMSAVREMRDLSQEQLAQRSGLSLGYITNLETGRKQPSRESLDALAQALDVAVEVIGVYLTPEAGAVYDLLPGLVHFTRDESFVVNTPPESLVVPLADAAVMLGVAPASAYRMVREETFPVPTVKVGGEKRGRIMVPRAALLAFVNGPSSAEDVA